MCTLTNNTFCFAELRLEPCDIRAFMESTAAAKAKAILRGWETSTSPDPTGKDYTLARNYMIINLLINNGQRSGAMVNLQLRHLHNAERAEPDGSHVAVVSFLSISLLSKRSCRTRAQCGISLCVISFQVTAHKTGHIAPVTLVFTPDLWTQMQVFLRARKNLPDLSSELQKETAPVFVTYPTGTTASRPLNNSTLNNAIKSIWKAAGRTKPVSATQLRKATATKVQFYTIRKAMKSYRSMGKYRGQHHFFYR